MDKEPNENTINYGLKELDKKTKTSKAKATEEGHRYAVIDHGLMNTL